MITVERAPIRNLIYSCLSAYGDQRGGELPGPWFSRIFSGIDRDPSAVRLALFRMVQNRELEARREGRSNFYRLSSFGRAGIEAGRQMLFDEPEKEWDGSWTIVHFHFSSAERVSRDHIRDILTLEGFGCLGRGVYLHPRDRGPRILRAIGAGERGEVAGVVIFRGRCVGGETSEALAGRLWDTDGLNGQYDAFLRAVAPLKGRMATTQSPQEDFFTRIGVVLLYLNVAWRDPELPPSLLPERWLGFQARARAGELYEALSPGTLAHGDAVLTKLGLSHLIAKTAPRPTERTRKRENRQ